MRYEFANAEEIRKTARVFGIIGILRYPLPYKDRASFRQEGLKRRSPSDYASISFRREALSQY